MIETINLFYGDASKVVSITDSSWYESASPEMKTIHESRGFGLVSFKFF